MIFALVGSLVVTLTLLPVLCSWFMRKGVRERRNAAFEAIKSVYTRGLDVCLAHPWGDHARLGAAAGGFAAADSRASAPNSCRTWMKARCGCARRCRTRSRSTKRRKIAPQIREHPALLSRSHHGRLRARPARRRHRSRPAFSTSSSTSASSPIRSGTAAYRTKAGADRGHQRKLAAFPGIIFNYTQPAEDAVDEAETGLKSALAVKVFGADLHTLQAKGQGDQAGPGAGARHHAT